MNSTPPCIANFTAFSLKSLIAAAFLVIPMGSLMAGTLIEPFSAPLEGIPTGWVRSKKAISVPDSVAQVVPFGSGSWLSIERPSSVTQGYASDYSAAVYYTGSTDGIENGVLSDFSGMVTMNLTTVANSMSARGVMLRAQSASYSASGYFVAIYGGNADNPGGLGIWKDPVSHTDNGLQLDFVAFSQPIVQGVDYVLHFSAIGAVLKAELTTADGATSLASLELQLDAGYYESGLFGARAGNQGANTVTYFKDVNITTAIPEPKVAYVAVIGIGLIAVGLQRKQL